MQSVDFNTYLSQIKNDYYVGQFQIYITALRPPYEHHAARGLDEKHVEGLYASMCVAYLQNNSVIGWIYNDQTSIRTGA